MNRKIPHGFSLIELMIVLAILGILSTIALPNYHHYMQKARFTEVILAAEPFKIAITLNLQSGYSPNEIHDGSPNLPPTPPPTKNLSSLKIDNGTITATSSDLAGNLTYVLKPNTDGSHWSVSGSCVKAGICETS